MARPSFIDVHNPPSGYGLTALVGDGSDETTAIQAYLDLAKDGANQAVHLMFGPGRIYGISDTLVINKGIGLRITGGGLAHGSNSSSHDHWLYTPKFRAISGFSSKAMLQVQHHAGLVLNGISFDGLDSDRTSDNNVTGIEVIASGTAGLNGSKHVYNGCGFYNLTTAWSRSRDSVGADGTNGDSYRFTDCDTRVCRKGLYIDAPGCMQVYLNHCGFASMRSVVEFGDGDAEASGGQLYMDSIFIAFVDFLIRAHDNGSNNMGMFVRNLKMDNSYQVYRPKLYEERDVTGTEQGRTRGPVVFENIVMSTGVKCEGTITGIDDSGGKCLLRVVNHSGASVPLALTIRDGYELHVDGTGISAYDYSTSGTVFTVNGDSTDGGDGTVHVLTDVTYVSDQSTAGTWLDATPIFDLKGGARLQVRDSYLPLSMWQDGSLVRARNSTWADDRSSMIFFDRVTGIDKPSVSVENEVITLVDPESSGSDPFYRFTDCDPTYGLDPPWSEANYTGGESVDWTTAERNQIRHALGIDGTRTAPSNTDGGQLVDVDGITLQQAIRIILAVLAGRASGVGTTSETYRTADNSLNRLIVQLDSSKNRTGISYGLS